MSAMLSDNEIETLRQSLLNVHRYLASKTPAGPDAPGSGQPAAPDARDNTR
jgi:hypothetical protein